jgi:HEAT repeat protein
MVGQVELLLNMNCKLFPVLLVALAWLSSARAQDYNAAVTALLPRLADPVVSQRYAAQMELQALASEAARPGQTGSREALGNVLATRADDDAVPQPARVWIVRQLQYMGGAEAVPALTKVLNGGDAELRECVRRALEQNPAPAANTSLLAALAKGRNPVWRAALLHSLGQRREVASVAAIAPLLTDSVTAAAAAEALGNIAAPEAVQALQAAPTSPAVTEALLNAARRCPPATAAAIYERLLTDSTETAPRAAALRGLARTAPEQFAQVAAKFIASPEPRLRDAAVDGCAHSPAGAAALAKALPDLPPATRAQALNTVEQWDFATLKPLLQDEDAGVRAAALGALARLGSADAVQLLVRAATTGETTNRAPAQSALRQVRTTTAFAALRELATQGEPATRVLALGILAARNDPASVSLFVACLRDPEPALRRPALTALRQLGGEAEMEAVARFAVLTRAPEAAETLAAMAARVTEKASAADRLLALAGNDLEAIAPLADALAVLGGAPALYAVGNAAARGKPETREATVTALGNWPDLAAAAPLLAVAADATASAKLQSAALGALADLVRAAETTEPARREEAILPALGSARQPADRKRIIAALATVPTPKVGEALRPLLTDPAVRNEAALAAVAVAEGLQTSDRTAARELAQAVKAAGANREAVARAEKLLR